MGCLSRVVINGISYHQLERTIKWRSARAISFLGDRGDIELLIIDSRCIIANLLSCFNLDLSSAAFPFSTTL